MYADKALILFAALRGIVDLLNIAAGYSPEFIQSNPALELHRNRYCKETTEVIHHIWQILLSWIIIKACISVLYKNMK